MVKLSDILLKNAVCRSSHFAAFGHQTASYNSSLNGIEVDNQGPNFDDMSSFFPCEIDDAVQYINLGY